MSKNKSSQSNSNYTDSKSNNNFTDSNQPDFGGKPEKSTSTSSSKNSHSYKD